MFFIPFKWYISAILLAVFVLSNVLCTLKVFVFIIHLESILYFFIESPGHLFFKKVINMKNISNLEKYLREVDNTSRDIALSLLERYIYGRLDIFPFIASYDEGLLGMFKETKPDFILKYDKLEIPVHLKINKDMQKKHLKFFESKSAKETLLLEDSTLREVMGIYEKKKKEFITVISNQVI